jgi:hypothetical protein
MGYKTPNGIQTVTNEPNCITTGKEGEGRGEREREKWLRKTEF